MLIEAAVYQDVAGAPQVLLSSGRVVSTVSYQDVCRATLCVLVGVLVTICDQRKGLIGVCVCMRSASTFSDTPDSVNPKVCNM